MNTASRLSYATPSSHGSARSLQTTAIILFVVLAIVFGLIAASGNLIAIALTTGVLAGGFLLIRLDMAVTLVLVGTLLINGVVGLAFPGLTKLAWLFSMLGFFLFSGSILTRFLGPNLGSGMPGFISALIVLMVCSVASSFFGSGSIIEIMAGTKRTYQLWGLMLALAIMPIDATSVRRINSWIRLVFVVALLQFPAALLERLILVPKRVGMGGGVVPIDIVSGTFEASLEGGGSSSIMVIFLIIVLAYVFTAWKDKAIGTGSMCAVVLLLGAPLFLGETKIALVLLPMMFVMVFAAEIRRHPLRTISAMMIAGLLTALLAWVYLSLLSASAISPEQQLQKAIDYNFGNVGYYDRYSLNRTTATSFWFGQHGLHNPIETVFGHGIGSSYSGAGSLVPGHLNKSYPFMAINLTALSTLLWDTGLLGTTLFVGAFIAAWRASARLMKNAVAGVERARLVAVRVSLACNAFAILYSNSLLAGMSHETILAMTFGYLAWLVRAQDVPAPVFHSENDRSTPLPHA
ncbi:MAG: hypothetical protein IPL29_09000 [Propionivibrio sp.]|nr:hypothetical protein [Propionivibrio sp.]